MLIMNTNYPNNKNHNDNTEGEEEEEEEEPIVVVRLNDVLIGRGSHCRDHVGTQRFLALCRSHLEEFYSSRRHETKNEVASRILLEVRHRFRGRFLQLQQQKEDGGFREMDDKTALQKIKQSIRDCKSPTRRRRSGQRKDFEISEEIAANGSSESESSTDRQQQRRRHRKPNNAASKRKIDDTCEEENDQISDGDSDGGSASEREEISPQDIEEAKNLFSFLSLLPQEGAEVPTVAREEIHHEREVMTEKERVAARRDVYGWDRHQQAKFHTRMQTASLLRETRREVERSMTSDDVDDADAALLAQFCSNTATAGEFGDDDRLELFLRREDMHPQVRYARR